MKVRTILFAFVVLTVQGLNAQKKVYIPGSWKYNATTEEYTEDGNKELQ